MLFSDFGLHPDLVRGVDELGFTAATPIQVDAIPAAMTGTDVLACAMTGSGKTAAFLLPILNRIHEKPRGTTRALVVTPTRELALQIVDHFAELAKFTRMTAVAVCGGMPFRPQETGFRRGADVIVATPGRLLDHFQASYARLDGLEVLVLDEADRMLDMGFLPDVRRVVRHCPRDRQTLFFSATMPREIVSLAGEMVRSPITIDIGRPSAPATGVDQTVYKVPGDKKQALLLELLRGGKMDSVIAFTRTKHRADRLDSFLSKNGISSTRIHGNRSQPQRTAALDGFKAGTYRVLVATDIAARGIDVDSLSHVVNFDVPNVPDDYIHRVGRTARAQSKGDAFTFVSPEEEGELRAIERALGRPIPRADHEGYTIPEVVVTQSLIERRARRAPPVGASRTRSFRPRW